MAVTVARAVTSWNATASPAKRAAAVNRGWSIASRTFARARASDRCSASAARHSASVRAPRALSLARASLASRERNRRCSPALRRSSVEPRARDAQRQARTKASATERALQPLPPRRHERALLAAFLHEGPVAVVAAHRPRGAEELRARAPRLHLEALALRPRPHVLQEAAVAHAPGAWEGGELLRAPLGQELPR